MGKRNREGDKADNVHNKKRKLQMVQLDDDMRCLFDFLFDNNYLKDMNVSEINLLTLTPILTKLRDFEKLYPVWKKNKKFKCKNHRLLQKKINTIVSIMDDNIKNKTDEVDDIIEYVSYNDLGTFFSQSDEYIFYVNKEPICGTITSKKYNTEYGCFDISYYYYSYYSSNDKMKKKYGTLFIYDFNDKISIDELNVSVVTAKLKKMLVKRGKKYIKYCRDYHHMYYDGPMWISSWFGSIELRINGRIMVDHPYHQKNTKIYDTKFSTNVPLHQLDAFLGCYDLKKHRTWGLCAIDKITNIKYNDDAFTYLTLDSTLELKNESLQLKQLIKDLVLNKNEIDFTDMIDGKGTGLIFLLHGPPGVGKTLTAEATSEVLHIPLYYLTCGELGSTVINIENTLKKVIELIKRWNAVLLIDEADVFLEKRDSTGLKRNSIVSIFLKYLEHCDGVIFLTSNRVDNIDPAVLSRVSLILQYDELSLSVRKKIWINQLKLANIDTKNINISLLAKYKLNGRQIKNIIKLSQCMTYSQNTTCNTYHIVSLCEYYKKNHNL
jgi:hypothetical protein